MKPLVSVVVPFFNEEDNVAPLAERVAAVFTEMPDYEYECLFVNDGSRDATRARIEAEREKNARVRPIRPYPASGNRISRPISHCAGRESYTAQFASKLQDPRISALIEHGNPI